LSEIQKFKFELTFKRTEMAVFGKRAKKELLKEI